MYFATVLFINMVRLLFYWKPTLDICYNTTQKSFPENKGISNKIRIGDKRSRQMKWAVTLRNQSPIPTFASDVLWVEDNQPVVTTTPGLEWGGNDIIWAPETTVTFHELIFTILLPQKLWEVFDSMGQPSIPLTAIENSLRTDQDLL